MTKLINESWSRVLLKRPREVFEGESAEPKIVDRIRAEGKKRKWSGLYENQPLEPGDWVRVNMRASGPSTVKSKIKAGTYKGYTSSSGAAPRLPPPHAWGRTTSGRSKRKIGQSYMS
jgi:hypothetical protein